MKSNTKPATSKLVAKFDTLLMEMLREDLKAYRAANPRNNQATAKHSLKAA